MAEERHEAASESLKNIQFDRKGKKKGYGFCVGWSHGTGSEVSICHRSIYLSEPVLKTLSSNVPVKNSVDVVLR